MKYLIFFLVLFVTYAGFGQHIKVIKYPDLATIVSEPTDKILVINFWATWCGPCVKELPLFEALNTKYGGDNMEVLLVSFDFVEQKLKAEDFATKKKLKSKLLLLDETDYNAFIDKIDPSWSGAIPATLMVNSRKGKKEFFEREFKANELEEMYLKFAN